MEEEEPAIQWKSLKWRDGTEYEGLVNSGKLHSYGVLKFPSKDRYEGQFENGAMDGYGVYVWADGTIYRGDWTQGRMHGCGVKIWRRPDGTMGSQEGKFLGDEFVGPVMPCSKDDAFEAAVDADMASYQARSFQLARSRQGQPPTSVGCGGNGAGAQQGARRWWGGGGRQPAVSQQQPKPAAQQQLVQQPQAAAQQQDLPPEVRHKVAGLLERLMASDAAAAADAQRRALSQRQ